MKKLSRILTITTLSMTTAAFTAAAFAASPAQDMPKIIRHDMPNYALTDSSSYAVSKSLIVNGQKLDMQPLQLNGCLLVPARAVSDALGFTTTWNAAEQAVTITGWSLYENNTIPRRRFFQCRNDNSRCSRHDNAHLVWSRSYIGA